MRLDAPSPLLSDDFLSSAGGAFRVALGAAYDVPLSAAGATVLLVAPKPEVFSDVPEDEGVDGAGG